MKSFLNFWVSLPGVLTGLAAVITAIAGLYGAGVFENKNDVKIESIPTVENTPKTVAKTPEIEIEPDILKPKSTPTPEIETISQTSETETETESKPTPTPTPKAKEQIVETDYFKFQLQNCQRAREKVTCPVLVTNLTDSPRSIYLYIRSDDRAIDPSGDIYNFTRLEVGKRYTTSRYVETTFSPSLPTKANFYLEIPKNINKLAGLEFSYSTSGDRDKLALRNISIIGN